MALMRMARHIKRIQPDIIHVQSGVIWELVLKKLFPRIPLVVTMHDLTKHPSWTEQSLRHKLQQWALDVAIKSADALIVHGESMFKKAEECCRAKGLTTQIVSIPHGIITRYGTGVARVNLESPGNVLFFGFINKYKGLEYLLKAEPLIRKKIPAVNIRIEGATDRKAYYRGLLDPESQIQMVLKRVDDHRVSELFRWADIIVLPYIEASQSGVLQLAMAFAVPPIVTRVGGLPEVVVNENTGLVVAHKDEVALANATIRLLTDVQLRARVIHGQRAAREGEFAWTNIARQTVDLYRSVLSRASA